MVKQARVLSAVSFLFLVSLVLTAYSVRHPEVGQIGSQIFQRFSSPFQIGFHAGWGKVVHVWSSYVWLVNASEENRELRSQLSRLEAEMARLQELPSENASLREFLQLKQESGYDGVVASVIGSDPSGWIRAVTVDHGTNHGLRARLPVISGAAAVGQVSAASRYSSQVLLLNDRSSGVAALVQRTRARGVVTGLGSERYAMEYVGEDEDVQVGDEVVTSGMDGIFPKGLRVGQVTKVEEEPGEVFQRIELRPAVDFAHLETLFIITGDTQESLEGKDG